MTTQLRIERVLELPELLTPSTMYLVKSEDMGLVEVVFSTKDGDGYLEVINKNQITNMIAGSMEAMNNIQVVNTLAERDELALETNTLVLVLNEEEQVDPPIDPEPEEPGEGEEESPIDPELEEPGEGEEEPLDPDLLSDGLSPELYMYAHSSARWILLSGFQGIGSEVSWLDIVGRPNVSALELEQAVALSHEHGNMDILEAFSKDEEGNILVDGQPVAGGSYVSVSEW